MPFFSIYLKVSHANPALKLIGAGKDAETQKGTFVMNGPFIAYLVFNNFK